MTERIQSLSETVLIVSGMLLWSATLAIPVEFAWSNAAARVVGG